LGRQLVVLDLGLDLHGGHTAFVDFDRGPRASRPEEVDALVVRDLEEPRSQGDLLAKRGQTVVRLRQRLLKDILAVERRSRHAGAIAVEVRPHGLYQCREPRMRFPEGRGQL
jgi:hypothetical protein